MASQRRASQYHFSVEDLIPVPLPTYHYRFFQTFLHYTLWLYHSRILMAVSSQSHDLSNPCWLKLTSSRMFHERETKMNRYADIMNTRCRINETKGGKEAEEKANIENEVRRTMKTFFSRREGKDMADAMRENTERGTLCSNEGRRSEG